MDTDIAIRLAAAVEREVTVDQARRIVQEFLDEVKRCPACGDSGTFKFGPFEVKLDGHNERTHSITGFSVPADTTTECPLCGGLDLSIEDAGGGEQVRGDPKYLAWHCMRGASVRACRQNARGGDVAAHLDCGYRILLRLTPFVPPDTGESILTP